LAVETRNVIVDALAARHDGGSLCIYTAPRPAGGGDPVSTMALLLSEHRYSDPAYEPAENGQARARPISLEQARAGGQAAWYRAWDAQGQPIRDGAIGTADADLVLSMIDFLAGDPVAVRSVLTCPEQIVMEAA